LFEATTSFLFLHLHAKVYNLMFMGETALCQRPVRARLQWVDAWVKLFIFDVGDVVEELTMWLRNVVPPVVTENHLELDVTLGRTKN